jgi:hypothetical protein
VSGVRWKGPGGQGDISPTGAQLAALEDFREVHGNPTVFSRVALTKDAALAIGRKHGLTKAELGQVMDEWLGFNRTRAAVPS